jgi:hypothetical protein
MKRFSHPILILLLLELTKAGFAQQIKFRDVLGNTGYDYGMSAQQTFDKGYIVCGSTTSVGSGNTDIYVIKTDSLGKPVNERFFGGINVDQGTCIKQTADSGYVILGYTNGMGAGGYDIYTIKTDAQLNILWQKTYGGTDWDFGNSIEQTTDGGYVICGSTYSYGHGDEDYYLIKTNSTGDTLWTKTYGGAQRDEGKSAIQTMDGGYALTGYSLSLGDTLGDFYTVKTNAAGDVLWKNTFGGLQLDLATDILEQRTGGFIVCGETKSFGNGKSDGILVEISNSGISGRTFLIGDKDDDNLQSLTERTDGKIMFTGLTKSYGFTNGKGDLYFGMMNPDWSYNMSTTFGSTGKETVGSVAPTDDKGAIICGTTNGFRNLLEDIYLIKTDSNGYSAPKETVLLTRINEQDKSNIIDFSVFPNPVQDILYLDISTSSRSFFIQLVDVTGRILKQESIFFHPANSAIPLNVNELADGIYFVKITTGESAFSKRFVVSHE